MNHDIFFYSTSLHQWQLQLLWSLDVCVHVGLSNALMVAVASHVVYHGSAKLHGDFESANVIKL